MGSARRSYLLFPASPAKGKRRALDQPALSKKALISNSLVNGQFHFVLVLPFLLVFSLFCVLSYAICTIKPTRVRQIKLGTT